MMMVMMVIVGVASVAIIVGVVAAGIIAGNVWVSSVVWVTTELGVAWNATFV